MCQLTFLQGDARIVKAMLGNLTLSNANDNNKDGHGFFFFKPVSKYYRTKDSGSDLVFNSAYWDIVEKCAGDNDELAVLAHVRSASIGFREIKTLNAHPFIVDNIILAHNGTLEAEDDKLEIKDRIDSFWFTHRLATIVNKEKLTPEHIAKAMEDFRGKFAFLIADLTQPTKLFIVKGRSADLYYGVWKDKAGNNKCYAVNTSKMNMYNVAAPMFWRSILGEEISLDKEDIEEFDDESIYIWDVAKKTLDKTDVKIPERTTITKTTTVHHGGYSRAEDSEYWNNYGRPPVNRNYADRQGENSVEKLVGRVCYASHKFNLSFSEMNYLFTMLYGYSILFSEKESLKSFEEFLEKLEKSWETQGEGKKENSWINVRNIFAVSCEDIPMIEIYEKFPKLKFPWWFNAKSGFKNVRSRIQSGNFNG